jgi:hypothetical protein
VVRILAVFVFAASQLAGAEVPSTVTRDEAIAVAERYVRHPWKPSNRNIFHGADADGVRVDTPDAGFRPADGKTRPGWWKAGAKNLGMPYKWGGFDLPEEFDRGIREGRAAGDIYTAEKRRLLDTAVSRHAVGIDCSGLISRCWRLPRSYSTRELTALCEPVRDLAHLKPGDIFNLHNSHVVLFASWKDASHQRLYAYEAGSPPSWKAQCNDIPISLLTREGYTAWRYRGIKD